MTALQNDRLIKALQCQRVDRTPIWIMRQAGRYLPEYRQIREKAGDFLTLCKTPELACEVTLQPLQRFDLDAAIIFSDILTIPEAMGLDLYFAEGEGPKFNNPIAAIEDITKLTAPDLSALHYVIQAIQLAVKELNNTVPLIGFAGSPWTLATYMIEGGSSKNFFKIKKWLYTEPNSLHKLLTILKQAVTQYLLAQIEAGVSAIQIFDTWGGILTSRAYQAFSLQYMKDIVKQVKKKYPQIPIILFTKNGGQWLESIADTGCNAIGIDWTTDLAKALQRVGHKVSLQGNLDPAVLLSTPKVVRQQARTILSVYNGSPGHIFNLGHGIDQATPIENVETLIETVHRY